MKLYEVFNSVDIQYFKLIHFKLDFFLRIVGWEKNWQGLVIGSINLFFIFLLKLSKLFSPVLYVTCTIFFPIWKKINSPFLKTELENIEVTQGMSAETAVTFLSRLMAMVDVLVFASSLNFSEIEAEKNMSSGGLMRQCLRLGK